MDSADFLFEEYKHLTDSFLRNEELGERQVNLFLTFTTTVIGAFAVIKEIFNNVVPLNAPQSAAPAPSQQLRDG